MVADWHVTSAARAENLVNDKFLSREITLVARWSARILSVCLVEVQPVNLSQTDHKAVEMKPRLPRDLGPDYVSAMLLSGESWYSVECVCLCFERLILLQDWLLALTSWWQGREKWSLNWAGTFSTVASIHYSGRHVWLLQEKSHQWSYPESWNNDSRCDVPIGIIANAIIMGES